MKVRIGLASLVLLGAAISIGIAGATTAAASVATHTCPPGMHWVPADNACDDNAPRPNPIPSPNLTATSNIVFSTGTFQAWMDSSADLYKQTDYVSVATHMGTDNWIGPYIAATGILGVNVFDTTGQRIAHLVRCNFSSRQPKSHRRQRRRDYGRCAQEVPPQFEKRSTRLDGGTGSRAVKTSSVIASSAIRGNMALRLLRWAPSRYRCDGVGQDGQFVASLRDPGYSCGVCQSAPTTLKSWLTKIWCGQLTPI